MAHGDNADISAGRIVVLADDRTGALETAALIAQRIGIGVAVHLGTDPIFGVGRHAGTGTVTVVDIGTRHAAPAMAARRAVENSANTARQLHKIDSTLRGNWAAELVAAAAQRDCAVVVVPSFPAVGRICRGGVVLEHGLPVHQGPAGADPLGPIRSSRPSEMLREADAHDVVEVADHAELSAWLRRTRTGFAVCDAEDQESIAALANAWSLTSNVVFAGTAAAVAAAVSAIWETPARSAAPTPLGQLPEHTSPAFELGLLRTGRVLIVCGSLHRIARKQLQTLERLTENNRNGRISIEATPLPAHHVLSPDAAGETAETLSIRVRERLVGEQFDALVVIGGDTTAALLGADPVIVQGTLGEGTAVFTWKDHLVVTRAGGFGGGDSLARLLGVKIVP